MKIANRPALLESYINALIDNMTLEDMEELLYSLMESDFERISEYRSSSISSRVILSISASM